MKPTLLGIAGYARSGKNTVGDYLTSRHGYEQRAFADKLRELALAADPLVDTGDSVYGVMSWTALVDLVGYEQAKGLGGREMLVALGAGARQVLGPDVWLDALLPEGSVPGPGRIVVTDVRYVNEAKRIQALGGTLVYVSRSSVSAANGEEAHSLSRVLAECAPIVHLYNNGTLEDLYAQVEARLAAHPVEADR